MSDNLKGIVVGRWPKGRFSPVKDLKEYAKVVESRSGVDIGDRPGYIVIQELKWQVMKLEAENAKLKQQLQEWVDHE